MAWARLIRPLRVWLKPLSKLVWVSSIPSPTICTQVSKKVTDISTPAKKGKPSRAAWAAAGAMPATSSWSVSAHSSTPLAWARCAKAAGASVPSDTVEWQCKSALQVWARFTGTYQSGGGWMCLATALGCVWFGLLGAGWLRLATAKGLVFCFAPAQCALLGLRG